MNPDLVLSIGRESVILVLKIGAPMLGFGLAIGLTVSILMSATQIQEMTLTFVPKIVAVLIALIAFAPWMLRTLTDFTIRLYNDIPMLIG